LKEEKTHENIAGMFDRIAGRYDFLNRFLSLGTDRRWRRRAISEIGSLTKPSTILDVSTGTADLAIASLRLHPSKVTGIDISEKMLERAAGKIRELKLEDRIELCLAPSERMPFPDSGFDVVMSAFGVRNFADTASGLSEMYRVLAVNGVAMILEFSQPRRTPFRQMYAFYFNFVVPRAGSLFSGDRGAYRYLPDSVNSFPEGNKFLGLMEKAGFRSLRLKRLTFGIATIYTGRKFTEQ
jgi:demethylmenaquinone methyltransferase/2-methoxy-6-polyprenyl-1,4-benzoquinol methylase